MNSIGFAPTFKTIYRLITHLQPFSPPSLSLNHLFIMKFTTAALTAVFVGALAASAAPSKRARNGKATWYRQGGSAGSCGKNHSDNDKVIAVPSSMAGQHCGQKVTIQHGGKQETATVADECPSCAENQIDLSRGAFESLASFEQGEIPIEWWFNGN